MRLHFSLPLGHVIRPATRLIFVTSVRNVLHSDVLGNLGFRQSAQLSRWQQRAEKLDSPVTAYIS